MPNQRSLEQIKIAELILVVDDDRAVTDTFKLPAWLRTLVETRLADLKTKDAATLTTEAERAAASRRVRESLDKLKNLLRDGFNHVKGLGSYAISEADRIGVFTAYGWEQGEIGDLTDARTESLANQAITATPTISNPAWRYPAALITLITDELTIVNDKQPAATGGTAQAATDARDLALELLQTVNDRVRFYYCSASDDEDRTAELTKIGKQPRRAPGDAQPQELPGVP